MVVMVTTIRMTSTDVIITAMTMINHHVVTSDTTTNTRTIIYEELTAMIALKNTNDVISVIATIREVTIITAMSTM